VTVDTFVTLFLDSNLGDYMFLNIILLLLTENLSLDLYGERIHTSRIS